MDNEYQKARRIVLSVIFSLEFCCLVYSGLVFGDIQFRFGMPVFLFAAFILGLVIQRNVEINDMKSAGRIKILSDMRVIAMYLHLYRRDKSNEYLTVNLSVDLKDYIVDENSFALIEGKTDLLTKHYLLTYMRSNKDRRYEEVLPEKLTVCPNCMCFRID